MQEITTQIKGEYITLVQLLKYEAIISAGSEITAFIIENDVYYNGELEKRKRKKIYNGDIIKINDEIIIKVYDENHTITN